MGHENVKSSTAHFQGGKDTNLPVIFQDDHQNHQSIGLCIVTEGFPPIVLHGIDRDSPPPLACQVMYFAEPFCSKFMRDSRTFFKKCQRMMRSVIAIDSTCSGEIANDMIHGEDVQGYRTLHCLSAYFVESSPSTLILDRLSLWNVKKKK